MPEQLILHVRDCWGSPLTPVGNANLGTSIPDGPLLLHTTRYETKEIAKFTEHELTPLRPMSTADTHSISISTLRLRWYSAYVRRIKMTGSQGPSH